MTAKIKGTIVTPDQKPVRVSIHAAPIPEPATGDGTVIIAGDLAIDQTSPINVDVIPGTYRLTVYAPTRMLTARSVTLKEGDTLDLASILEAAPDPAGPAPGVALIDGDGKLITCANIQVVHSREEADALPDGTVYVMAASAPAPVTPGHADTPAAAGVQLIDHAAGSVTGDTITVMLNGQTGDRAVVAINTKAVSDQAFTWPPDWTVLVDPYWVGTEQFAVASGPWSQTINVKTAKPTESGWAGLSVHGGGTPTVGTVKDRTKDPKETTTVTAPTVDGAAGLVLAFGFERSAATETRDQITISTDWEIIDFATQDGANYQTVLLAKWSGTGTPTPMVATYPNAQATNGAGVEVVIPNA
nr:MAG TPA: hypothetical protein [Caudoviricetes sp.]